MLNQSPSTSSAHSWPRSREGNPRTSLVGTDGCSSALQIKSTNPLVDVARCLLPRPSPVSAAAPARPTVVCLACSRYPLSPLTKTRLAGWLVRWREREKAQDQQGKLRPRWLLAAPPILVHVVVFRFIFPLGLISFPVALPPARTSERRRCRALLPHPAKSSQANVFFNVLAEPPARRRQGLARPKASFLWAALALHLPLAANRAPQQARPFPSCDPVLAGCRCSPQVS